MKSPSDISVLIVDDHEPHRENLTMGFNNKKFKVTSAENAITAREIISSQPIDVLVTRIRMREVSGIELINSVHEKFRVSPGRPAFLAVGDIQDLTFEDAYALGLDAYFHEPVSCQTLTAAALHFATCRAKLIDTHKTIENLKEHLIISDKMALLGSMVSGIAHEINNPLTVMLFYAANLKGLLEKEGPDRLSSLQEEKEFARKIETTSLMISKIVDRLRCFSRDAKRDPFVKTPIGDVVENAVEMCREFMKLKSVHLAMAPINADLLVECRPLQICQVLVNLIKNAVDAVGHMLDRWVDVQVQDTGKKVMIFVTDSGKGIPPAILKNLFKSFFTTKTVEKGTGLGLSISRDIISEHGGSLYVDVAHPHTRFVIELPKKIRS